jgi:multidrug efflux system outer membrane protein
MNKIILNGVILGIMLGCKTPQLPGKSQTLCLPEHFSGQAKESGEMGPWKNFIQDPYLRVLIDSALANNQELNIELQEIHVAENEVYARSGEYRPYVQWQVGTSLDKVGRYTRDGAVEHNLDISSGKEFPEPLSDFKIGLVAGWEVDIWKKMRASKKAAYQRYMGTVEGRNFLVTQLVAEIAHSYYELQALDQQLEILEQSYELQSKVLNIISLLKNSTRANELAVSRFQAQVLKTNAMRYDLLQKIVEAENRINLLVGRMPQKVDRSKKSSLATFQTGVPADLLRNRPDIRRAELELEAQKLDVYAAKMRFYPALAIEGGVGWQAFNPTYLVKPASILFQLGANMAGPLINKRAITADYKSANARQIQALYNYERSLLQAVIEVETEIKALQNLESKIDLKKQEVEALTRSVEVSEKLFNYARADYMEVLLTQREALEVQFELIESELMQKSAQINLYKALGGGWF